MDGDSFDRLSVGVHRLRERITRRGALGALLGGLVVSFTALIADDTDARRRRRKNKCKGIGFCSRNRDCCFGGCRNGFCRPNGGDGGGGGGNHCNGVRCGSNEECCYFQGIRRCLPYYHPACDFDGCGCGTNQQCCGNGLCCPDLDGWYCGDFVCEYYQNQDARAAGEPDETAPFEEPASADEE